MTQPALAAVPVIIVSFRNDADVSRCLQAVSRMYASPALEVVICENGGRDAFDRLVATLTGPEGPCISQDQSPLVVGPRFARVVRLQVRAIDPHRSISIHIGEATENLGYAGGVNAWLEPLQAIPGWPGAWILNPDTEPAPSALMELMDYAERHGRGMVGSRISPRARPDLVHSRGLIWRKWRASALSVDLQVPAAVSPPDDIDSRLDSPSGASLYVTRHCIECIGLMDEKYFLYCEDLDWGLRAKKHGGVGYAHQSVILHIGGTTIGTSTSRKAQSRLAVYLEFRNRLLFVRSHFAAWLPWTIVVGLAHLALYLRIGDARNLSAALRGMLAGLAGRSGRPDAILEAYLPKAKTGLR